MQSLYISYMALVSFKWRFMTISTNTTQFCAFGTVALGPLVEAFPLCLLLFPKHLHVQVHSARGVLDLVNVREQLFRAGEVLEEHHFGRWREMAAQEPRAQSMCCTTTRSDEQPGKPSQFLKEQAKDCVKFISYWSSRKKTSDRRKTQGRRQARSFLY